MKTNKILITFLIFLAIGFQSYSQVAVEINKKEFKQSKNGYKEAMRSLKAADTYYSLGHPGAYRMALAEYLRAYEYNQYCPELNYKIGACYLYSTEKAKAITFLEKAYKSKPGVAFDIHFLLGQAFQYNFKFDEALDRKSVV